MEFYRLGSKKSSNDPSNNFIILNRAIQGPDQHIHEPDWVRWAGLSRTVGHLYGVVHHASGHYFPTFSKILQIGSFPPIFSIPIFFAPFSFFSNLKIFFLRYNLTKSNCKKFPSFICSTNSILAIPLFLSQFDELTKINHKHKLLEKEIRLSYTSSSCRKLKFRRIWGGANK